MLDKKVSKAMWKKSIYNAEMESILTRVSCGAARSRKSVSEAFGGREPVTSVSIGGWQRDGATSGEGPTHSRCLPGVIQNSPRRVNLRWLEI